MSTIDYNIILYRDCFEDVCRWTEEGNYNELVNIPGSGNKYRAVQLNGSGLRYAPIRQINMSGNRTLKYNSIQRKFDRWLRSGGAGNGYLVLPQLKIAELGKGYRSGSQIDI